MSHYAIQVEGLGKEYVIGGAEERHDSFREMLSGSLLAPIRRLRKLGGTADEDERFWALRDLNFSVVQGEVLGIIGQNGAGKSTLLKVLSRITAPTTGRIQIRGRAASLLEVGTGFHPELTGRENIFLNGAVLGMSRSDISRKFNEIVEFAEVSKFLDTPVKRYSSGMYVRLAFSVAAHLDPDILLVDEVLAVGDTRFQNRCLGKMDEVANKGRTVIFVSHNMGMMSKLCKRGIVLHDGRIVFDDTITQAISHYFSSMTPSAAQLEKQLVGDLHSLLFEQVILNGFGVNEQPAMSPSDAIKIQVKGKALEDVPACKVTVVLKKEDIVVSSLYDSAQPQLLPKGDFSSNFSIPAFLLSPGTYKISIGGFNSESRSWRWATDVMAFSVIDEWFPQYDTTGKMGIINLQLHGERQTNTT